MTDEAQAQNKGFYCAELVAILRRLGLHYEWKFVTNAIYANGIGEGSIVYLKRSHLYPAGHYMAKAKHGWMDPWSNFHENSDIKAAESALISRLPYRPSYVMRPVTTAANVK